jgi:hypothetical protein
LRISRGRRFCLCHNPLGLFFGAIDSALASILKVPVAQKSSHCQAYCQPDNGENQRLHIFVILSISFEFVQIGWRS